MKLPFDYKNNNMPWSNLPDGFKSRLVQLAPMVELSKFTKVCPDIRKRCLRRPKVYNRIFLTDKESYIKAARDEMNDNQYLKQVSNYTTNFKFARYLHDGPVTFDQRWDSVLCGDALNLTKPIYIKDTLILHCRNVDVYEAVIPFIYGSYSRLAIYGEITWDQFKRLLHGNVKQVRIEGKIDVDPSEYDDVVNFIQGFCRGFVYKFSFRTRCFEPIMLRKLKEACERHETHKLVGFSESEYTHFIHKNYRISFFSTSISSFVINISLFSFAKSYFIPYTDEETSPLKFIANTMLALIVFLIIMGHFGLAFNFLNHPTDRRVVKYTTEE